MYTVELTTRLTPVAITVEKKELDVANNLYKQICQSMETGIPRIINLTCDTEQNKKICVLTSEILAVQTYEDTHKHQKLVETPLSDKRRAGFRV